VCSLARELLCLGEFWRSSMEAEEKEKTPGEQSEEKDE
jgi:hypothetical protein